MQAPATTQRTKLSVETQEATGAGERLSSRFPFVRPGEEAEQEVRRYHPERTAVVAVDVGKDVNHLYIRTSAYQEIVPPLKLQTLATGYEHVVGLVDELLKSGAYDLILLGHEPTGIYHEAWSHALVERYHGHRINEKRPALRYRQINPVLVKQERQRKSHRKRKTDERDVAAMAELLSIGVGNPVLNLADSELKLRTLLQYLRISAKQQIRQTIQIRNTLDRLWPGALGDSKAYRNAHPTLPPLLHLVESKPLERQTVRILLAHCPNPYHLREIGPQGIRQLFHANNASCGPKTAQRIYDVAQQSLLPPPVLMEILVAQVQAEFELYCTYQTQIEQVEEQAAHLLAQTDAACLLTFPGIGHTLAARYLAGLGDPSRFSNASQIWSFAGYDTLLSETGNSKRKGKISYRGCPYLRGTLFQIGHLAAKHSPACNETYRRALRHNPSKTRATIHVANKANGTRPLVGLCYDGHPTTLLR